MKIHFSIADGRVKFIGGDQDLRTSTLVRQRPIQGESHLGFLGESELSSPAPPQDSLPDAGEAINDFWSMSGTFIYRHHVEPRVRLLLAESRIISYFTEIRWRLQNYTRIWMLCKKAASMTTGISMDQEICLILGQVSLSFFYWMRNLQTDICGPVGDWPNVNTCAHFKHMWAPGWAVNTLQDVTTRIDFVLICTDVSLLLARAMWKSPIPQAMTAMQQQQVDQDILRGRGSKWL